MKTNKKLGEMLIESGVIDPIQLNAALGQQRQWGGKLGSVLIKMGFADEMAMVAVLEKQLGEKCVSLAGIDIPKKALSAVKIETAKKYCIIPLDLDKNTLNIAVSDPTDVKTLDELSFLLGVRIKPVLALESEITNAISEHYEGIVVSTGREYHAQINQLADEMQIIQNEPPIAVYSQEEMQRSTETGDTPSRAVVESVVEAVVSLLIEKKIFTRQELAKKLAEKSRKP